MNRWRSVDGISRSGRKCPMPGAISTRLRRPGNTARNRRILLLVAHDLAGVQFDHAFAHGVDDLLVVCGHDDGGAGTVDGVQHFHDAQRRGRVEVARRLVGEQDLRMVHIRPCDGDALRFAAGQLMGVVVFLACEPHRLQYFGHQRLMVERLVPITSSAKATFSHTVLLLSSL